VAVVVVVATCSDGGDGADPPPRPTGTLRVVSLNVLHGFQCPPDSDHCAAPDRVALLARLLTEARCPDVVALQEVSSWMHDLVTATLPVLCDGRYRMVTDGLRALDTEVVLTPLPVRGMERTRLAGGQRTALWVRVAASLGSVDVVVTHVGAGADGQGRGGAPCAALGCEPPCRPTDAVVTCQVEEVIRVLERHRSAAGVGLLVGDFNVVPGSPPYRLLIDAGLVDTYLAAGHPECDPTTATGCTGGRDDRSVQALRDPRSGETERIDFTLLRPGRCRVSYGPGTGLFADRPVPDGPGGLAWPSDHVGTALDLSCR
jgi:endonuclease/exonuclease/phosphatase family metal-dependent hydrolase